MKSLRSAISAVSLILLCLFSFPLSQVIVNEHLLDFLPELVEYHYYPTLVIRYRSPEVLQGFQMTITPVASALLIDKEVGMAKGAILTSNEKNGKIAGIHLDGELVAGMDECLDRGCVPIDRSPISLNIAPACLSLSLALAQSSLAQTWIGFRFCPSDSLRGSPFRRQCAWKTSSWQRRMRTACHSPLWKWTI